MFQGQGVLWGDKKIEGERMQDAGSCHRYVLLCASMGLELKGYLFESIFLQF